jgi:mono/diheme cytochrome c family protein
MSPKIMRRLILAAGLAALGAGVAVGQGGPPAAAEKPATATGANTQDDAAAALASPRPAGGRRGNAAEAVRAFLGLGTAPDAAAAGRGAPIFAQSCASCHGQDARGGIGPNLLYSTLVLDDEKGDKLVPFLAAGRPGKGMPGFPTLSDTERHEVAEWLHLQIENYANRGTYKNVNDVLVGNAAKGAAYFRKNCTQCHSATGDLKGVSGRYRPLDLQRAMIFPPRDNHPGRMVRARVTTLQGTVEGIVGKIDDFTIVLTDAAGQTHAFARGPGIAVALTDPLAGHKAFAYRLKDSDMTDLVTYLASLK